MAHTIELRELAVDNYQRLRDWRNKNRTSFVFQGIVTPEMHDAWFEKYVADDNQIMYVVYFEGNPVGAMGLTLESTSEARIERVMLGDDSLARKGVMGRALEEMMALHGREVYSLVVLKNNQVAVDFYVKYGFEIVGGEGDRHIMKRTWKEKSQ